MKPLLPLVAMVFASCSSYQYLTVSSESLSKNKNKELVWENDSLIVSFNFNGGWGMFDIQATNKTSDAISINWLKSAVVYDGKAYSLFDESVSIQGEIERNQLYERRPVLIKEDPVATMKADMRLPKQIDFMPPNSSIARQHINISRLVPVVPSLSQDLPIEKVVHDGVNVKFRKISFDAVSSPLKFSIFLTFVNGAGKEFHFNQPFYAAEIKQTDESSLHSVLIAGDGDKFYRKITQ